MAYHLIINISIWSHCYSFPSRTQCSIYTVMYIQEIGHYPRVYYKKVVSKVQYCSTEIL